MFCDPVLCNLDFDHCDQVMCNCDHSDPVLCIPDQCELDLCNPDHYELYVLCNLGSL